MHRLAQRLRASIPEPFTIAICLTCIAMVAGIVTLMGSGHERPVSQVLSLWVDGHHWLDVNGDDRSLGGLWSLLAFGMQMALVLVTGFVVASTGPVARGIDRLAAIPKNTGQGAALVALVAMSTSLVNWGLGLVVGALAARQVGLSMHRSGRPVHYPLLAAAGYTGLCVWHGGLSGSAPLKVTRTNDLVEVLGADLAAQIGTIELGRTIGSLPNLAATGLLLITIPLLLSQWAPRRGGEPPPASALVASVRSPHSPGFAGWLETRRWAAWLLAVPVIGWLALNGSLDTLRSLDLNTMNLLFIGIGLTLVDHPRHYMDLAAQGAKATAGILIQFPLYGGILGILAGTGLAAAAVDFAMSVGAPVPLATFASAGLVNLFVPSGGGQWAIQGPIMLQAAVQSGVDPARVVMALSWGDQWTNLFQPFWALPLLGITGAKAGDILGYTAVLGIWVGVVFGAASLF